MLLLSLILKVKAQVSKEQQKEFGKWNLIAADTIVNKNYYDSIGFKNGPGGSTICTLFLKNTTNKCKHLTMYIEYMKDGDAHGKLLDVFVKPNGEISKYVNYHTNTNDYYSFYATKLSPITLTYIENSTNCSKDK